MGESKKMEELSVSSRTPTDLLQRFMERSNSTESELKQDNNGDLKEEIELNLGLSLGGRFGVDKTPNKLIRSSSIAGPFPLTETVVPASTAAALPYPSLVRTSSLPVETEEEWRKRKEIQSMRRMAAKQRRTEKQRAVKGEVEVNSKEKCDRGQYIAAMSKVGSSATPQFGLPSWAAAAKQSILGVGIEALIGRGKISNDSGGGGSGGSKKVSTDTVESEKNAVQGTSNGGDVSRTSIRSAQDPNNQTTAISASTQSRDPASIPPGTETENPSKNSDTSAAAAAAANRKKTETNSLEDMPSVFTKGDGPNGRRIEGILYQYGKGEDVRIMCVCHGTFHSPAGFVKHAGGTDINHPLKHIVVNSTS